ncbi:response regulator transcription factor [Pedobacter sp. SD-b]|uniref:Response regulator transcription factor n=1 Tax=Pedobacter segetis TaxID=2793069 RepID=A0ABS1BIA8_9SPHI|nr:LytTR family DNA-binding domain-containing protein [Pedobacter segetis]MBK0382577.1 response regulator transcription factor [Pedobacter segetis]
MISIVIIDDELHCTASLQMLIDGLNKNIQIIAVFNDARLAQDYLRQNTFDLLFLDIEMPGLNGFELLNSLSQFKFDVVFTTAYDQYAIKAFNFSAVSYLLKPIDPLELSNCIDLWERKNQKYLTLNQFDFLIDSLQNGNAQNKKLALPTTYGLEFIAIENIIRCQSESSYTHFFLKNEEKHLICRTLKEVEQILFKNGFVRIHQSHLINPAYLKKYIRNDGGYVLMEDGEKISVSKSNKDKITEIFDQIGRNQKKS